MSSTTPAGSECDRNWKGWGLGGDRRGEGDERERLNRAARKMLMKSFSFSPKLK